MLGNAAPDPAAHAKAHIRDLAHRPVLASNPQRRPFWQVAGDRLDGARRNATLSSYERRSIARRVKQQLRLLGSPLARSPLLIATKAIVLRERGRSVTPWVEVLLGEKKRSVMLDLRDGKLYDVSGEPFRGL